MQEEFFVKRIKLITITWIINITLNNSKKSLIVPASENIAVIKNNVLTYIVLRFRLVIVLYYK